jgi:hypothetical protein
LSPAELESHGKSSPSPWREHGPVDGSVPDAWLQNGGGTSVPSARFKFKTSSDILQLLPGRKGSSADSMALAPRGMEWGSLTQPQTFWVSRSGWDLSECMPVSSQVTGCCWPQELTLRASAVPDPRISQLETAEEAGDSRKAIGLRARGLTWSGGSLSR